VRFIVTVQTFPFTVSQPDQEAKEEPASGVAVRVTTVPLGKDAEQPALQLMPEGELVTVPYPPPDLVRVRV